MSPSKEFKQSVSRLENYQTQRINQLIKVRNHITRLGSSILTTNELTVDINKKFQGTDVEWNTMECGYIKVICTHPHQQPFIKRLRGLSFSGHLDSENSAIISVPLSEYSMGNNGLKKIITELNEAFIGNKIFWDKNQPEFRKYSTFKLELYKLSLADLWEDIDLIAEDIDQSIIHWPSKSIPANQLQQLIKDNIDELNLIRTAHLDLIHRHQYYHRYLLERKQLKALTLQQHYDEPSICMMFTMPENIRLSNNTNFTIDDIDRNSLGYTNLPSQNELYPKIDSYIQSSIWNLDSLQYHNDTEKIESATVEVLLIPKSMLSNSNHDLFIDLLMRFQADEYEHA
jgi:hypothetical protein